MKTLNTIYGSLKNADLSYFLTYYVLDYVRFYLNTPNFCMISSYKYKEMKEKYTFGEYFNNNVTLDYNQNIFQFVQIYLFHHKFYKHFRCLYHCLCIYIPHNRV